MILKMSIEQGDDGWVLEFRGHDLLPKTIICETWDKVLKTVEDYFGWYDLAGKQRKNP